MITVTPSSQTTATKTRGGLRPGFYDSALFTSSDFLHKANTPHQLEPRDFFLGCVPPSAASRRLFTWYMCTSKLLPDLAIQEPPGTPGGQQLTELEMIVYCVSRYPFTSD